MHGVATLYNCWVFFYSQVRNIFPHISLRDLPCHRTMKILFLHQVFLKLWSVVFLWLQQKSWFRTYLCSSPQYPYLFDTLFECNPNTHVQAMVLVLPNQRLSKAFPKSVLCFLSCLTVWTRPHTWLRIVHWLGWQVKHSQSKTVGGSFSARVPRSSAEVRRVFMHHILEDEADGQKEDQGDQRKEDEEEEMNGDVETIRETHNAHETLMWWCECGPKLEPSVCTRECESLWKMDGPVGCSRLLSAVNDFTATSHKKSWKSTSVRFCEKTAHNGSLRCIMSLLTWAQLSTFFLDCHELHRESFHCHQLEKELDDECHCWHFQNGTALSCPSPDSWWRRLYVVNASFKSERSLTGPIFSKFIERDPPILSVSKVLFLRHSISEIFLRILVHLDTDPFSSIMFELRFTKYGIFQETIVNSFKIPLYVSLSQFMGIWWSLCSLVFPHRWPWCRPFFRT